MRSISIAVMLAICVTGASAQKPSRSLISQLPNGTLSGNTYTNDAVALTYEFPAGWTATPDLKDPAKIDFRHREGIANQCSKVLVSLAAPGKAEGRFNSIAMLLAIDPACFSGTTFPRSLEEKDKIRKVVNKIVKPFSDTPFISPYDNMVHPFGSQGRVIIELTGALIINAYEGQPAAKKEPLRVHTSFTFTESTGYWVAWAFLADDSSTEELKNVKVVFKNPLP